MPYKLIRTEYRHSKYQIYLAIDPRLANNDLILVEFQIVIFFIVITTSILKVLKY